LENGAVLLAEQKNISLHITEFGAAARELFLDRGQNRESQIDGIIIEFGPRFCPRNKRPLKNIKKVFDGFGPLFCPRNKRSLKTKKVFARFGPRSAFLFQK